MTRAAAAEVRAAAEARDRSRGVETAPSPLYPARIAKSAHEKGVTADGEEAAGRASCAE